MDLPTLNEQDTLMADEDKIIVSKPVVAAVPTVDNNALLDMNEGGSWELEEAVRFDEIECAGMECKLRKF